MVKPFLKCQNVWYYGIKGNMLVAERTKDNKCCYCSLSAMWGMCHSQNPLNAGYTSWAGWPIAHVCHLRSKGMGGGNIRAGERHRTACITSKIQNVTTAVELTHVKYSNHSITTVRHEKKAPHVHMRILEEHMAIYGSSPVAPPTHDTCDPWVRGAIWRSISPGGLLE